MKIILDKFFQYGEVVKDDSLSTAKGCFNGVIISTILWIIIIVLLTGCATDSKYSFSDFAMAILAAKANSRGYNWQQGIRDGNESYNTMVLQQQRQQLLNTIQNQQFLNTYNSIKNW